MSESVLGESERRGDPRRLRYRFSAPFVVRWLLTAALGARRSLVSDAARELRRFPAPHVEGRHHLPEGTPFILVANHYERSGLRVWWTALALTSLLSEEGTPPVRWFATDRFGSYRLGGLVPIPASVMAVSLRIISRRYGLLLVARNSVQRRAPMLRVAHRALHQEGHALALFPEGERAVPGQGLATAFEGSGEVLAWLSAGRIPVIPAGVHDDADGVLCVHFGEPWIVERGAARGAEATAEVMRRIAALLPAELRGAYAEVES